MDAVGALYADGNAEVSERIVAGLSRAIFSGAEMRPAGRLQQVMARVLYRLLRWTTNARAGADERGAPMTIFSNPLLERSGHPYARSLLGSSRRENASMVEGGDPMNGPYMMIAPEIRRNCGPWDRLFFGSVQARDVQSRFAWETRATHDLARRQLDDRRAVRLKAVAAGTGLSMILAYDRLVREGYDPGLITVTIADREEANIVRADRLLRKLATTRENRRSGGSGRGICAQVEDIFPAGGHGASPDGSEYDVVTAVGILEYFQGASYATTEQRLGMEHPVEPATAHGLVKQLTRMTKAQARLIVNTYRDHVSTRILELFGKRFDYRRREHLRSLLASVNFRFMHLAGSGNIYDVEIYQKSAMAGEP